MYSNVKYIIIMPMMKHVKKQTLVNICNMPKSNLN